MLRIDLDFKAIFWKHLDPVRSASGTSFGSTIQNAFQYNTKSEVIRAAMGAAIYGYGYDNIGNRFTSTNGSVVTTYEANALNQYTVITSQPNPEYDDDGNMTRMGSWVFSWDAENRLVSAIETPPLAESRWLKFSYDYMSRRYKKEVYVLGMTDFELQYSISFLYDSWNMIKEVQTAGEQSYPASTYVWGLDLSQSLQGAGGVGGLLATIDSNNDMFTTAYDANGNVTEYLNMAGAVAAHYQYDSFGNTVNTDASDAFSYRFSTKQSDAETGIYYYGYRYYVPGLGRWLNRDKIEEIDNINIYSFVSNNGIISIDIYGLADLKVIAGPDTDTYDGQLWDPIIKGDWRAVYTKNEFKALHEQAQKKYSENNNGKIVVLDIEIQESTVKEPMTAERLVKEINTSSAPRVALFFHGRHFYKQIPGVSVGRSTKRKSIPGTEVLDTGIVVAQPKPNDINYYGKLVRLNELIKGDIGNIKRITTTCCYSIALKLPESGKTTKYSILGMPRDKNNQPVDRITLYTDWKNEYIDLLVQIMCEKDSSKKNNEN